MPIDATNPLSEANVDLDGERALREILKDEFKK